MFYLVACCASTLAITSTSTLAFCPVPHRINRRSRDLTQFASASANTRDAGPGGRNLVHDGDPIPSASISELESLLSRARHFLDIKNPDEAFETLAQAFRIDPTSSKVSTMFEACLGLRVDLAEEGFYKWRDGLKAPSIEERNDDLVSVANVVSEQHMNELFQDRVGLSSLLIDRERYDEAGIQLRKAIDEATLWLDHYNGDSDHVDFSTAGFKYWQPQIEKARYLLYRTNAACCRWESYFADGDRLRRSLLSSTLGPAVHPFDALKFPCISLELASDIARRYARRALETVGVEIKEAYRKPKSILPRAVVTAERYHLNQLQRRIRIGYISPDFTSRHPLAFLMQHVFRCHDKSQFVVSVYSLSCDSGPEVQAIRESSDVFTYLSPSTLSPVGMYQKMMQDELDILVDLCGYAGTSIMSEIMASREVLRQDQKYENSHMQRFPIHVSYMGFPGSCGSSVVWDYSVFDPIVVPPEENGTRRHYEEALVFMPHSYFVNSHKSAIGERGDGIMVIDEDERKSLRSKYGIRHSAFVYCCHSRADKIDPSTFRSWMRAITHVRSKSALRKQNGEVATTNPVSPVLWMLRSGDEMEKNIRQLVREEFGKDMEEDCLVFADVVEREEHLRRLGIADVFLDTPAYNAHTLGCDALYMGVPMISLLHKSEEYSRLGLECADVDSDASTGSGGEMRSIATEKLASRVGASLLLAVGLKDLIFQDMTQYEGAMARCALDEEWFYSVRQRLLSFIDSSPLFDTERWVENWEAAFRKMAELDEDCDNYPDIFVSDIPISS